MKGGIGSLPPLHLSNPLNTSRPFPLLRHVGNHPCWRSLAVKPSFALLGEGRCCKCTELQRQSEAQRMGVLLTPPGSGISAFPAPNIRAGGRKGLERARSPILAMNFRDESLIDTWFVGIHCLWIQGVMNQNSLERAPNPENITEKEQKGLKELTV